MTVIKKPETREEVETYVKKAIIEVAGIAVLPEKYKNPDNITRSTRYFAELEMDEDYMSRLEGKFEKDFGFNLLVDGCGYILKNRIVGETFDVVAAKLGIKAEVPATREQLKEEMFEMMEDLGICEREEIITGNESFRDDLGAGSLDMLEFAMRLENKYLIFLENTSWNKKEKEQEFVRLPTVNEAVDFVAKALKMS